MADTGATAAFIAANQRAARALDRSSRTNAKQRDPLERIPSQPKEFRVVVLGDASVGKTSFIRRLLGSEWEEEYEPTLTEEALETVMTFTTNGGPVALRFVDWAWDQMYQSKGDAAIKTALRGADGAIFMFSYADPDSFKSLNFRFNEFEAEAKKQATEPTFVLVGNKKDAQHKRWNHDSDVQRLTKKRNAAFAAISAYTEDGINAAASILLKQLLAVIDDVSVDEISKGLSDAFCQQVATVKKAAALNDLELNDLSDLVMSTLALDNTLKPDDVASEALIALGLQSLEGDDTKSTLVRCAVLGECLSDLAQEETTDADRDAFKSKNLKASKKKKLLVEEIAVANNDEAKEAAKARAQAEDARRAERLRAKALEREEEIKNEEARKHDAKTALEVANAAIRDDKVRSAKAKAADKARRAAVRVRTGEIISLMALKGYDALDAIDAAGRASVAAERAAKGARQAALVAKHARFESAAKLVSTEWPEIMIHYYTLPKKRTKKASRGFSFKLTFNSTWRKKTVQELLNFVCRYLQTEYNMNVSYKDMCFESLLGSVLGNEEESVYDAAILSRGCFLLRRRLVAPKEKIMQQSADADTDLF